MLLKCPYAVIAFDDQAACKLCERFILEYYRREHPQLSASAPQAPWALDDGFTDALPVMQTDIMLRQGDRVHITDEQLATIKDYTHMMQQRSRFRIGRECVPGSC